MSHRTALTAPPTLTSLALLLLGLVAKIVQGQRGCLDEYIHLVCLIIDPSSV